MSVTNATNRCVICNEVVPEGTLVCSNCFKKYTSDGTENYDSEECQYNHPTYYNGAIECIDAMSEVFGDNDTMSFCLCNAFKYLWRCKNKHRDPIMDVKKAKWYLDKYIELYNAEDTQAVKP